MDNTNHLIQELVSQEICVPDHLLGDVFAFQVNI